MTNILTRSASNTQLQAAYDLAAKGNKNDSTRTNDKNDELKIDSKYELLIYEREVNKLKNNKKIDDKTYASTNQEIQEIKNLIEKIYNVYQKEVEEINKTNEKYGRLANSEKYKKEHPIKHFFAKLKYIMNPKNTDGVENAYKQTMNQIWNG